MILRLIHDGNKIEGTSWQEFYDKLKEFFKSEDLFEDNRTVKAEYFIKGRRGGMKNNVTKQLGEIVKMMGLFYQDVK
jgi:hypothetical protein